MRRRLTSEEWRADLQLMMGEMERQHLNVYHSVRRAELTRSARTLSAAIPSPSQLASRSCAGRARSHLREAGFQIVFGQHESIPSVHRAISDKDATNMTAEGA